MRQRSADVQQQASGLPTPPVAAGSPDGVYAGPLCYGPIANEPARCCQAEVTIRDRTIVGEWRGRDGVAVKVVGEVSTSGEVKMEMHAERMDGSVFGRANLSGTVENGRLEANGSFLNGRTVSFKGEPMRK